MRGKERCRHLEQDDEQRRTDERREDVAEGIRQPCNRIIREQRVKREALLHPRRRIAERRADDASREVVSWLKCRYISQFCGKSFEGTVTGVIAAGLYVTLDDPYVEGFVHVSKIGPDYYEFDASENTMTGRSGREKFYIGKRVKATGESADTETLRVDFTIYTGEREGFGSRGFGRRRFDDWDFDDDDDDGDDWSSFREDFDFDEDFPKPRKKRKKKNKNKNKTVAK